jgi:hypothetical protein
MRRRTKLIASISAMLVVGLLIIFTAIPAGALNKTLIAPAGTQSCQPDPTANSPRDKLPGLPH